MNEQGPRYIYIYTRPAYFQDTVLLYFAPLRSFTQRLNQTQLASGSIQLVPHNKPQQPNQRISHFGASRFQPRYLYSRILIVRSSNFRLLLGRSLYFRVTFYLGACTLQRYFLSRRPTLQRLVFSPSAYTRKPINYSRYTL